MIYFSYDLFSLFFFLFNYIYSLCTKKYSITRDKRVPCAIIIYLFVREDITTYVTYVDVKSNGLNNIRVSKISSLFAEFRF